jgi:outer membrane protein assembly factor BamB
VERLSGLAFDAAGTLWATSITGSESGTNRTSMLLKLDPSDGSLLETIGPVLDGAGGPPIAIESLAFQPGTGALFGSRGIADLGRFNRGDVYRLDPATGVATLFADNDDNYGLATIVFAPDGTMYLATATYPANPGGSPKLQTLDPSTGAILASLPTARFYKALAVRDDGALFGASSVDNMASAVDDFFRIDPSTGIPTFIGQTGDNPIGSLAFGPDQDIGPCGPEGCPSVPRPRVLRPAEPHPVAREVVRPSP